MLNIDRLCVKYTKKHMYPCILLLQLCMLVPLGKENINSDETKQYTFLYT